ncbi:hypothetical protein D3C76_611740 [compost metagenome]
MYTDLWSFAVALYARPGIEKACLELQSEGADVCLLLCGAWLGQRGVTMSAERLAQLQGIAGPWQAEVVKPLRQLRQQWRQGASGDNELATLRKQVKELELEAERRLLARLETLSLQWPADEGGDPLLWLQGIATHVPNHHRDALQVLRAAASRV